jgi:hypothetical protein
MPITSSFNTFFNGLKNGNNSQAALGAVFLIIDVASFGEGGLLIKGAQGTAKTVGLVEAMSKVGGNTAVSKFLGWGNKLKF